MSNIGNELNDEQRKLYALMEAINVGDRVVEIDRGTQWVVLGKDWEFASMKVRHQDWTEGHTWRPVERLQKVDK